MIDQSLLKKVQGLLSKTIEHGCTVEEAASSAALAQKLIQKHKLSMSDIEVKADDSEPINQSTVPDTASKKISTWKGQLVAALCTANDCKAFVTWASTYSISIVGRNSDVQIVNYMFMVMVNEIERLCKIEKIRLNGHGKTWTNSFKIGAVSAISLKLKEAKTDANKTADTSALVRIENRKDAVYKWMNTNKVKLHKKQAAKFSYDNDAYTSGLRAGENISAKTALNTTEFKRLS